MTLTECPLQKVTYLNFCKGVSDDPTAPFKMYKVGSVRSSLLILMHVGSIATSLF